MKTSSKTSLKTCLTASLAFAGWSCTVGSAQAVEIRSVEVEKVDDEYRLVSQVWFDVDQAALYRVFIDFDLHHRFSTYTQASENVVIEDSPIPGFYIRNRACVLFFCREFERSGIVEAKPQNHIRATADAELSDFHVSVETWELETEAAGTVAQYNLGDTQRLRLAHSLTHVVLTDAEVLRCVAMAAVIAASSSGLGSSAFPPTLIGSGSSGRKRFTADDISVVTATNAVRNTNTVPMPMSIS